MMDPKRLSIAYVTRGDVTNRGSFRVETRYYIAKYLEKHLGDVEFVGPLDSIEHSFFYRVKRRIYKYVLHKRYLPGRAPRVLDHYAKQVREKLEKKRYDLVFSPDSIVISHLDVEVPIFFYTDSVFDAMVGFYREFANLCLESIHEGHQQEQAALTRTALAIYSSQWAADVATERFDVGPGKVMVIPFGANLPAAPERECVTCRKRGGVCNLLFIGMDWERKGGEIAVRTVQRLNEMGLSSKLFVCGAVPWDKPPNEYIEYFGILDRNVAHENRILERLFLTACFLILPTKADCTPAVFREAAAFGLPVITTDVGGNRSVVKDGESGIVLPADAGADEYANAVREIFADSATYAQLSSGSRKRFDQALNWDSSITRVASLVRNLVE
jgi:glycosyltransferase involved in cell wall biosynthesis